MIASTRIQVEYQNSHKSNSDQSDIFSIAACIPKREKVKNSATQNQVNEILFVVVEKNQQRFVSFAAT